MEKSITNKENQSEKKFILCDYATANWGKTETLLKVIDILSEQYNIKSSEDSNGNDKWRLFELPKHKKVVVSTQGDPKSLQADWLKSAAENEAEIIVTACRTKGSTVEKIYDISKTYGHEIIWFQNFHFDSNSFHKTKQMNIVRNREAQNIVDIILAL